MHVPPIPTLTAVDPQLAAFVETEAQRQHDKLRMIASENYVSAAVLEASGTVLTNKYSEGYPGKRYYEGQQCIDPIETLAIERARSLFGVEHANVQPYSGSPANLAVYLACAVPGDTVMGMALPMGGHLTHGWAVSATGRWFRSVQYSVRRDTGRVDLDEVRDLAVRERPKLIFCGGTAIPRTIDFAGFAAIAREVDAVLVADIAHIAGLVAGGAHPSPVGHADIISTTTHKTLRGPRGAMLMCSRKHASAIDKAVFPGLQGGPHNHTTAAVAVALLEASQPSFRDYARQVVANAQVLAAALVDRGFGLVSGGTDNHLILVDLTSRGIGGKPAARALDRAGIELNYNTVPYDTRKPFDPSGIRLGTAALTTRGLGEAEMPHVAAWIDQAITAAAGGDDPALDRVAAEVRELLAQYPMPGWEGLDERAMGVILETERLILRRCELGDFEAFAAMFGDPEVSRFVAADGKPLSRFGAWLSLCSTVGHWALRGFGMFAVVERHTGKFVGRVGPWSPESWPGFEVGWTLRKEMWGKGYATEAAAKCVEYSFTELRQPHVMSLILPDNLRSIRVAERIGQRLECDVTLPHIPDRRVLQYGISREDWLQRSGRT